MTKFDDFLNNEKQAAKKKGSFDAAERIAKFLSLIEELYDKVDNEWLAPYIKRGEISTGLCDKTITEEKLGAYVVKEKYLEIGSKRIMLSPVGTLLIGTDARIDIEYRTKSSMIVHISENVNGFSDMLEVKINGQIEKKAAKPGKPTWKLVNVASRTSYKTITAQVFQDILMDLLQ